MFKEARYGDGRTQATDMLLFLRADVNAVVVSKL